MDQLFVLKTVEIITGQTEPTATNVTANIVKNVVMPLTVKNARNHTSYNMEIVLISVMTDGLELETTV